MEVKFNFFGFVFVTATFLTGAIVGFWSGEEKGYKDGYHDAVDELHHFDRNACKR